MPDNNCSPRSTADDALAAGSKKEDSALAIDANDENMAVPPTDDDDEKTAVGSPAPETTEDTTVYPSTLGVLTIFVGLCFTVLCITLDRAIVATAVPKITSEFNSLDDIGWYGSSYLMTMTCFQLFFGKLYAEYAIKWVFLSALLIFEVGSVVSGAAPSSLALILGRAISGVGGAGLISGALIMIARSVPLQSRPKYTGAMGGMSGIAQAIGPTIGGLFTDKVSWRWCFWINLPLGGVTFLVVLLFVHLPSADRPQKHSLRGFIDKVDLIGTVLLMPCLVCLLLALQWGGIDYEWSDWRVVLLLVFFSVLFVAWAASQYFQKDKATVPLRIVKQRSMLAGMWFTFCLFTCFFVTVFYVPIWFQAVRGTSAYQSGINLLAVTAAASLTVLISGIIVSRVGYYVPNMLGATLFASIGTGIIYTFHRSTDTENWSAGLVVLGLGVGLGIQQPIIAAQTVFEKADLALATTVIVFIQGFSGTLFLSVAQNVFRGKIQSEIRSRVPGVNPDDVLDIGASDLISAMGAKYPQQLESILTAYNYAIKSVFTVSLALACMSVIGSAAMEWRSVKKKKQAEAAKESKA